MKKVTFLLFQFDTCLTCYVNLFGFSSNSSISSFTSFYSSPFPLLLPLGWKWVQFRQAAHPTFWVCHKQCKSGCGSDLATYSHCTIPPPPEEAAADDSNAQQCPYKYAAFCNCSLLTIVMITWF